MTKPNGINFNKIGIGNVLIQYNLAVPGNQRSFAWEEEHVQTFLEDLNKAISEDDPTYFLGTIVLTHGEGNRLEVADGQQRLATVSILIASIRDYLYSCGENEKKAANKYTDRHLLEYDEIEEAYKPKLKLNIRDNDFFIKNILYPPEERSINEFNSLYPSHERIINAKKTIEEYVQSMIAPYKKGGKPKELYKWIRFICENAIVILIEVPDHINAYTMFETLNDRGLRASQTDILKNFLFGTAKQRLDEVQGKWYSMVSIIETIGDDDLILTHIRHAWIAKNGPTVERELAEKVKNSIKSMQQSVDIISYFEESANNYVALLSPLGHSNWSGLGKTTQFHIYVITNVLKITQILPLMLAISFKFDDGEKKEAFKLLLSLSVRFLISGVSGSGGLEKNYGTIAQEIMSGRIKKAKKIIPNMTINVPSNEAFKDAFKNAKVSKSYLARYYLRAIEIFKRKELNPEYGGVDDPTKYNLEHIMPRTPSQNWDIKPEIVSAYEKRLGNMILLDPNKNVDLGNDTFNNKKMNFKESTLLTTQEVGNFSSWGPDEINNRQEELANIVSEIWPI